MINVRDFGARGDGQADDYEPIQRALTEAGTIGSGGRTGGTVYIPAGKYLHSLGLRVRADDVTLVGEGGTTLEYTGDGIGFDSDKPGPYPTGLRITRVNFTSSADRSTTVRWRFSHSFAEHMIVGVQGRWAKAVDLAGDPGGTGPYYNTFVHCSAVGTSDRRNDKDQLGWYFSYDQTNSAPNANTWMGAARNHSLTIAWRICGAGNHIYSSTCESIVQTAFHIDHPDDDQGCLQNSVVFQTWI